MRHRLWSENVRNIPNPKKKRKDRKQVRKRGRRTKGKRHITLFCPSWEDVSHLREHLLRCSETTQSPSHPLQLHRPDAEAPNACSSATPIWLDSFQLCGSSSSQWSSTTDETSYPSCIGQVHGHHKVATDGFEDPLWQDQGVEARW